ncbi:MAG: EF-hand domain-containing protein [Victivallales bacterium]|jgi:Ca2+-binding EF-hand superfamily protein
MKKFLAGLTLSALFAGGFCIMAQDSSKTAAAPAKSPDTFKKIDRNGDGKISNDEYQSYWLDVFGVIDLSKDGKISEGEIKARADKRVAEIDRNKDGGLTRDEFLTLPKPEGKLPEKTGTGASRYAQADINADGSITLQEYYFILSDRFDRTDKNRDGKIDGSEAKDMLLDAFRSADMDKDGIVTKEEWLAYWVGTPKAADKKAEPAKNK